MSNNTTIAPFLGQCPSTYFCSEFGKVLPLTNESDWPLGLRAFLYLIGMLWCFLGMAIIADVFMCAIEKITSKTRLVRVANPETETGYEEISIQVWNDTVANLTLMALGSSAPEILLSCIEIILNNFEAGALGPSTIVGSAAFNLMVICAVCVMSIPSPDIRTIKAIKVFAVTATFSLFAYIWLLIILVINTPEYIDLWEAIVTLLFFPILVLLAYMADKDYCAKKKAEDTDMEIGFDRENAEHHGPGASRLPWRHAKSYNIGDALLDRKAMLGTSKMTEDKMRDFIKELRKLHPELTEEEIAHLASAKVAEEQQHNRLWYRINASRAITGGRKLIPSLNDHMHEVYEDLREGHDDMAESHLGSAIDMSLGGSKAVIEFAATQSAILEQEGRVRIGIRRYGKTNCRVMFKIETIDGTAESHKDYVPVKTTMVFEKDETYKHIDIEIIDDNEWEPDEVFFVKIAIDPKDPCYATSTVGKKSIHEVTIVNDDEPGTFEFSKPSLLFKESCGKAQIPVERVNGADGKVEIKWKTEDMSAHTGQDYEGGEGTLVFEHGETTKMLEITVYDDQEAEKDECFKVELLDVGGGAKLGRIKKTIVTIVNDDEFNGMVSRLVDLTNMNMDALRVDSNTYGDQFRNAMNVNGGDVDNASTMDYIMHFLTFGWKILFAIVPPPSICGGWLAFIIALMFIAIVTTIVADLASIFGCLVGLKPSVNAIFFVALGTSLPDLFASKQAAQQEKTADNSIGNVTGSNSVNVFLGLGLPWTIAAIYWTAKGQTFYVPSGSLAFSVMIFTTFAVVTIIVLMIRRYVGSPKGELGGATIPKFATGVFLIFLWVMYVFISALEAYNVITVNF